MKTFEINYSSQKITKTDLSTGKTSIQRNVEVQKIGESGVKLQLNQLNGEFSELFDIKQIGENGRITRTIKVFSNKKGNLIFEYHH